MKTRTYAGVAALFAVVAVQAQTSRPMQNPSASEIIQKLTPPPETEGARTRGFRGVVVEKAAKPADAINTTGTNPVTKPADAVNTTGSNPVAQPAEVVLKPPSIDLAINFEFASAKLTPDARITLDALGQALNDAALRESRFRVAGHTDAVGGDAANLALSKQRAQSVAEYLARQHNVAQARLIVEGFGRRQLLDAANPRSAMNRRVQIENLGQ